MGTPRRPVSASVGKVAVVVTVLNEQSSITSLVESLRGQTLQPSEVVIVDGGSTDQTFPLLQKLNRSWKVLKVFTIPGNRSQGRNFGVAHSTSPIIAFTDAGCQPVPNWLFELVNPFSDSSVKVISGYYQGVGDNVFQKSLITYCLVMPDVASKSEFYPSTRSMAIRRSIFERVNGFNERIDPSEDFDLAHRLKRLGVNFVFAPEALVDWHPRKNLSQAAWMFLRFAYGDIQARILRPKVRLLAARYLIFIYLFFLGRFWPWLYPIMLVLAAIYLTWAILKNYKYVQHPQAIFWLPVLQITSDFTVLLGTLMGLLDLINVPSRKS